MIEVLPLPADLRGVPSPNVADPDGEIERAIWCALRRGDNIGAAALALTIASPFRRAVFLKYFHPATVAAAQALGGAL
jgi:hypothetical protein